MSLCVLEDCAHAIRKYNEDRRNRKETRADIKKNEWEEWAEMVRERNDK